MYKGEVSTFRVYDRALTATEVDARLRRGCRDPRRLASPQAAQAIVDGVAAVTIDDAPTTLPDFGGARERGPRTTPRS